jgi:putative PIN family toxin of toxin-antitoxin system
MKVVLDTNIYVGAAITPRGPAGQVLAAWRRALFTILVSRQLMDEVERALRHPQVQRYLRLSNAELADLFDQVRLFAILVEPETHFTGGRDPDDDFVLETAVSGQAEYIVTNDNDLLDLGSYEDVEIVTAAHFIGILRSQPPG